jgi:excisionase family DNA binding protein
MPKNFYRIAKQSQSCSVPNRYTKTQYLMQPIPMFQIDPDKFKEYVAEIVRQVLSENPVPMSWNTASADPANEPMVTVGEAAKITNLAVNTLYDKTQAKAIPHYKMGKRLYFRPSELLAWLRKGRVMTQDEIEAKAVTHVLTRQTSPFGKRKGGAARQ